MKVCLTLSVVGLAGYLSVTSFAVAGGGADPKEQAGRFSFDIPGKVSCWRFGS
jgi:hypothetical protein